MATYTQTVGELIAEKPARAQVFEEAGIDFCCDERQTVNEACRSHGINPEIFLERLHDIDRDDTPDWTEMSIEELCDHIVTAHHLRLKDELPRLGMLLYRVMEAHAELHPELTRVLELFSLFAGDLKLHMAREEQIAFPLFKRLGTRAGDSESIGADVLKLLEELEEEHQQTSKNLEEIRHLMNEFVAPGDACETYRFVNAALRDMEMGLKKQVDIENNILLPRAGLACALRSA